MRRPWTFMAATMLLDVAGFGRPALARSTTSPPVATTWLAVAEPFTLIAAGIGLALAALMRRPPRS